MDPQTTKNATRRWFVSADTDYDKRYRHVEGTRYHGIICDADPDSDDEYGDPTRWFVSLREIDIATIDRESVASFVGFKQDDDGWYMQSWNNDDKTSVPDEGWAESASDYGCYAPLRDTTVPTRKLEQTIRKMMRVSADLESDTDAMAVLMDRPVNALGSTAREYMVGDLDSALARGLAAGNTNARIMAQIQSPIRPQGVVSANVQLSDVPSDDPLAYTMGFLSGFQGSEETEAQEDLATAYLDGRIHGADVRLGRQPVPGWVS